MKMTKEDMQKIANLTIADMELESICDRIHALKDLLEEDQREAQQEEAKYLDLDQDTIFREVAEKLEIPRCLVKRVVCAMGDVLSKHGSNCMVFTEAEKNEE